MSAPKKDPRVDDYIATAPAYAKPILAEIRARVFKAVPEIEETIKWRVPFYVLGGKLVASMAAFKAHLKFGTWAGMKPDMVDVTTLAELPSAKETAERLKAAAAYAEDASAKKPPAKQTAAKKVAAKKTTVKKAAAQTAAPVAKAAKAKPAAKAAGPKAKS